MANMSLTKTKMPSQSPLERIKNFSEVCTGYTKDMAINEATRCLSCKNKPCVSACPVNIDIPAFINEVKNGDFEKAYDIISFSSSLPAICGRVCPQENQCEGKCVRGIKGESVAIGRLERFVADFHNKKDDKPLLKPEPSGHKVAIIGSGPAGLSCAGELGKKGYSVTIFEALHTPGGVLVYGIPEFRLPKSIVKKEIDNLISLGVNIETNVVVGKTISIDELLEDEGFEAVFIGSGAGLPKFMNIKGENLKGVYSANEFLTRINLMKAYKEDSDTPVWKGQKVVLVGGGNVTMDAARSALRLGAKEVTVVYRRSFDELPARKEEVKHAMEEGVKFSFLSNPIEIISDENGFVKACRCIKMELGSPDSTGRRRPVEIKDSEFEIECDSVIMSIGTSPNPLLKSTTVGLDTQKWGGIVIDEKTGLTSRERVYAGGDAVTGAATVILAMGAGKNAANAIDEYLNKKKEC